MAYISVLLTGASGTIGVEVLKQLNISKKFKITVFDIKTPNSIHIFSAYHQEIEIIYGDISREQDLMAACIEKDVVIHLAAVIPPLADEQHELAYKVNVLGTKNLIKNLEQFSTNAFLLYSSSISVYGDRVVNPNIKVSDPLMPSERDEYAKTKIAAEELIKGSKLDWSIFRLCAIMGKHKLSKIMFHQPLNTSFEIASPQDTARAFVYAIEKQDKLSKKIYNLGGGEECRISYEEFLKRSFKIAGLGKLNFASKSFAEKNFHCGYYEDGEELENILHFRKDSINSHFRKEKQKTSRIQKVLISILRVPIKWYLQKQSEPLRAFKTNDRKEIQHYFKTIDSLNQESV